MHIQNHGLFLEDVHRVINQNAWLKPYIIMSLDLGKIAKNNFERFFLSSSIMQLLEKLWEMWENIDISQLEILSQQKEEGIT